LTGIAIITIYTIVNRLFLQKKVAKITRMHSDYYYNVYDQFTLQPNKLRGNKLTINYGVERFSNECRKTKIITLANHNKHKLLNEPIRTRSKDM